MDSFIDQLRNTIIYIFLCNLQARKRKLGLPEDDDVDASKEQNAGEETVKTEPIVKIRGKLPLNIFYLNQTVTSSLQK